MSELNHANTELSGFGSHSAAEVEQLQKALGLGGQGGNRPALAGGNADLGSYADLSPGQFNQGNALAVEDLDRTLKLVTFGLEHLRLWKDILKERVPQVVHEYNVQNAYGESEASPFFRMGSTPVETDAQYARDVVQIKYLGTKGAVLHNLTLIQAAHGPVVAREVKNKTIELLARNERAMFEADSAIMDQEYDGLDNQIITKSSQDLYQSKAFAGYGERSVLNEVVLNAGGADFDEDIAEDAALTAVNNFGMPMDMYLGTDVHSAFSRAFYAKQRTVPGESLTSGNRVTEHMGTLDYRFKPSLFNRPRKSPSIASFTSLMTPIIAAEAGAADITVLALPVSSTGESSSGTIIDALSTAGINVAASATPAFPATDIGDNSVNYLNIYTAAGVGVTALSSFSFLKRVKAIAAPTVPISLVNDEYIRSGVPGRNVAAAIDIPRIAGSAKAYLLMHDPDVLCWKQLGSMIKYDLAVTTTQYEWLQLLYGTPLIMAPRKNVIIANIKSGL